MCYDETTKLLKKYKKQYVYGERPTNTTQTQNRNIRKLLRRLDLLQQLTHEIPFNINNQQKAQVEHLIRRFNNKFKKLHRNASEETIILAFIFYIRKMEEPKTQVGQYSIARKKGLNENIFITIICRIGQDYMQTAPLNNTTIYSYDNDITYNVNTPLTN